MGFCEIFLHSKGAEKIWDSGVAPLKRNDFAFLSVGDENQHTRLIYFDLSDMVS